MRITLIVSIYFMIGAVVYFWTMFFFGDKTVISFVSNSNLTIIFFAIFVFYLSWQLFPRVSIGIKNRVLMAIMSVLFIPLLIVCFALAYRDIGMEGAQSDFDYIYFSVVTFTTLGYGDITPAESARFFAVLQALSGFLFVPLLISQLINTTKEAGDDMKRRERELAEVHNIIDRHD